MLATQQNLGQSLGNAPGMMRYLSFKLPLDDGGSGSVITTPAYNLGSGAATFTRNTAAYALLSTGSVGSVASGTARGSYNAAGTWLGYQAEGARADVLGTTNAIRRTMTDVGWVATTMTVGAATGYDGGASAAASLTATGANSTLLFTTVLASAARTFSAWVRRKTGTGTVQMTDDNGTTWTTITLTTTYTQFQVTRTQANPIVGFRIVTSADAIEVDFNTLEAASFANPTPIPVNVSKAADVLTFAISGNLANTGSSYVEISGTVIPNNGRIISTANGNTAIYVANSTTSAFYDAVVSPSSNAIANINNGSIHKTASSWNSSAVRVSMDGGIGTDSAGSTTLTNGTNFGLGDDAGNGTNLFGTIRNVMIFSAALSALQLTLLTT